MSPTFIATPPQTETFDPSPTSVRRELPQRPEFQVRSGATDGPTGPQLMIASGGGPAPLLHRKARTRRPSPVKQKKRPGATRFAGAPRRDAGIIQHGGWNSGSQQAHAAALARPRRPLRPGSV